MKSATLTKYARERIVDKLITHKVNNDKNLKKFFEDSKQFTNDVYEDLYGKDIEKMDALPKGWLPETEYITVQLGDSRGYAQLYFSGYSRFNNIRYSLLEKFCVKNTKRRILGNARSKVYSVGDPLTHRYEDLQRMKKSIEEEYRTALATANSILNSVNTTKQLIETWPEVETFVREVFGTTKPVYLPTIDLYSVNKKFDLPVEEVV